MFFYSSDKIFISVPLNRCLALDILIVLISQVGVRFLFQLTKYQLGLRAVKQNSKHTLVQRNCCMNVGCHLKFSWDFNRFMECEMRVFLMEQGAEEARSDKQGRNEIVRNFRYKFTAKITFGWKFQKK